MASSCMRGAPASATPTAAVVLLALAALTATSSAAAASSRRANKTDTLLYRVGFAHVGEIPGHRPRQTVLATTTTTTAAPTFFDTPGPDQEPEGFTIYDHVADLPDYNNNNDAPTHIEDSYRLDAPPEPSKCFVETRQYCFKPSFCGHVCEPVLLAVKSFCAETVQVTTRIDGCKEGLIPGVSCDKIENKVRWKPCQKARKYNRCYPKICYKKVLMHEPSRDPPGVDLSNSPTFDPTQVSIVRYKKPPPPYEAEARNRNQTSARVPLFEERNRT